MVNVLLALDISGTPLSKMDKFYDVLGVLSILGRLLSEVSFYENNWKISLKVEIFSKLSI